MSFALLGLWSAVWLVVGIVTHELAHALTARALGLRVAFCGVGYTSPRKIHFGNGETRWYIGLIPTNGLTYFLCDGLELPVRSMVLTIAAGPFSNMVLLAVGLLVLPLELLPFECSLALIVTSAAMATNLLPMEFGPKNRKLRSDGMLILQHLQGTAHRGQSLGTQIGTYQFLLQLSRQVQSTLGQLSPLLALAQYYERSGMSERAAEYLDEALDLQANAPPDQCLPELTQITQHTLGRIELDPDEVDPLSRDDFQLIRVLRLRRQERSEEAIAILKALLDQPNLRPRIRTSAEALLLLTENPSDMEARAEKLLRLRGAKGLHCDLALMFRAALCQSQLARDPESRRLQRQWKAFQKEAKTSASLIPDDILKRKYLEDLLGNELLHTQAE